MGKFIENIEKKTINKYIDGYMEATNEYSKYQQGSPTFTTYYSLSLQKSTVENGLQNVVDIVGDYSPLKYIIIHDFAMYLESEINSSNNFDEINGFESEAEGSAIILPNTIIPQPDDFFTISYQDIPRTYRITSVEHSSDSIRTFYKINFILETSFDINNIKEKQIDEERKMIYQNVGTELSPIIPLEEYTYLNDIQVSIDRIIKKYKYYFYDELTNSFLFNREKINGDHPDFINNNSIYDPKLSEFIRKNDLFISSKSFMTNIVVEPILERRLYDYDESIYSLLETFDLEDYSLKYYYFSIIKDKGCIFDMLQDNYHELVHNKADLSKLINNKNLNNTNLMLPDKFNECDLIRYVENKDLEIMNLDIYDEILIIYLRYFNGFKHNNISDYYKDIVTLAKKIKIEKSIRFYLMIPCVIYILQILRNKITNKE